MSAHNDARIIDSWRKNASPWTVAVRKREIESRKLVTDGAIVEAVLGRSPRSVLDVGCGEGWLVRELTAKGIRALGVDAVPALIESAKAAGGGGFQVVSYEEMAASTFGSSFDTIVCNFSLIGKEAVEGLFGAAVSLLNPGGTFIVQTLHPIMACGDLHYRDGWRDGSWDGFGADFTEPAPWYFRTLQNWIMLFADNGFRIREVREPIHPRTRKPASVIFIAEVDGHDRSKSA